MSPDRPGDDDPLDDPFADDPFEDPLGGDPLEDPFADDPFEDPLGGDPLEDPFADDPLEDPLGGDGGDGESDADIEEALDEISQPTLRAVLVVGAFLHVGVFAVGLGLLFLLFRGRWTLGGGLVIGGALALGIAAASYRRYRTRNEGADATDD